MISANLKQWIEIVGGVAIVVSLGLVVIEIRQNTDAVSAQAISDLNHQANESNLAIASSSGLAELLLRASIDPDALSAVDRFRADSFGRGQFNRVYTAYSFYQRGIFTEDVYEGWRVMACDLLKHEGPASFWANNRSSENPEFVRDIDSHCKQPLN